MVRRRRVRVVVAVVAALLGVVTAVVALAGGPTPGGADTASSRASAPIPPAQRGPAGPAPDGAAGAAGSPEVAGADARGVPDGVVPDAVPGAAGRDVVRTAELAIAVADPAVATRMVRNTVVAAGGVVAEEQVETDGAWLVVRVPVASLDRVVDDIAATGTVARRSGRAEDATEQVVDLDSRVATQQASITRVRALLERATSIGDVVSLESELARREADLDSLQRRLAALRDRVALATVTVELRRPDAPPAPPGPPAGFGSGLAAGWEGLRAIGTAVAVAAGFLLPILPVPALAAAVALVVRRRRARGTRTAGPTPAAPPAPGPATPAVPAASGTRGGPGPEGGV